LRDLLAVRCPSVVVGFVFEGWPPAKAVRVHEPDVVPVHPLARRLFDSLSRWNGPVRNGDPARVHSVL
jgi:hypothetical protein